eukprot:CAMPEP_0206148600 /NCGR_PEP_ID=MMETSP1473-20131121/37108_1 /ASSEMBLY_ACC=CAM_ASM_001109 /TAXON_ID=1461547 /ORGANISM="Stichococcus sp, Strain RCC1054" /LENGTH=131 /DNA_ID=CAMNT_0053545987 /DNA_START=280 /DNA_END=671 /DNA_ORIENTATION=-
MSSNRERHLFTVYPAPKATISKADFQRLMFKRAKVLALASVLDGASGILLDVSPQAAGQADSFAAAPGAAGVVLEEQQQQQQHLEAAERRGHLIQSRREAVSRRRREEWEIEQARLRHSHAAAAEAHAAAA